MKRILFVFLALILVACAAPAPAPTQPSAPEPSQTPVVIVETVVVTAAATQAPAEAPSATPLPTQEPTLEPTVAAPAATEPPAAADGVTVIDDSFGAYFFSNITQSRNDFSLRCPANKDITFTVKSINPDITQVELFYRFEDRSNGAVFDWVNGGKMVADGNGGFTITLSGDAVSPNFRKPNSWFDYQFIGGNATGVVGRSEKIEQKVSYTFDCP